MDVEGLAKTYLSGVEVNANYITGYTENENCYQGLLRDIENISGGFVRLYTKDKEDDEGRC